MTTIDDPNVMTTCGLLIAGKPCLLPPWHNSLPIHVEDLTPGTIFDTPFEQRCEVITRPDELTNFQAYDSDRVICNFSVVMVSNIAVRRIAPVPS